MNCLRRIMLVVALIGMLTAAIGVATAEATAGYRPDLPSTRHHDPGTPPALLDGQLEPKSLGKVVTMCEMSEFRR
jgi:hypothetical protein